MDNLWLNIGLVLFFIFLGGAFAAAELALVSLRDSQLSALERKGRRGQIVAQVARDPNTFLAAVQIGVTVSGFFSAAFGATALAPVASDPLREWGIDPGVAAAIGVTLMTLLIAYFSLVLGELAPKRLALQRAEGFALAVAPVIAGLAVVLRPLIWLVGVSSDAVVRLFGGDPSKRAESLSDEELLSIVESHEGLNEDQREILADVLDSADQSLIAVMRPRSDVEYLLSTMSLEDARKHVSRRPYSRYPVVTKELDDCEGFVHVRDLVWQPRGATTVADVTRPIPMLPSSMKVFPAISQLRSEGTHIALVIDEYGGADGLVTLEDLVEELIGEVYDEHDPADRRLRDEQLTDQGLFRGDTTLREFNDRTGIALPAGPYSTVAGFILAKCGQIPAEGDIVDHSGVRLVVHSVEGRRVSVVSVTRALSSSPSHS